MLASRVLGITIVRAAEIGCIGNVVVRNRDDASRIQRKRGRRLAVGE